MKRQTLNAIGARADGAGLAGDAYGFTGSVAGLVVTLWWQIFHNRISGLPNLPRLRLCVVEAARPRADHGELRWRQVPPVQVQAQDVRDRVVDSLPGGSDTTAVARKGARNGRGAGGKYAGGAERT